VKGVGDQIDYGFRIYDPRTGRFLSTDPLTKSYPQLTPYQFASNNPVENIDLDGLEKLPATKGAAAWEGFKDGAFLTFTGHVSNNQGAPSVRIEDVKGKLGQALTLQKILESFIPPTPFDPIVKPVSTFEGVSNQGLQIQYKADKTGHKGFYAAGLIGEKIIEGVLIKKIAGAIEGKVAGKSVPEGTNVNVDQQTTSAHGGNEQANQSNTAGDWGGPLDYSKLKEPRKVGPGLETTRAQRQRILNYNKDMNGGVMRSDEDGSIVDPPTNVPAGGKANMNQAEVDHIDERVNGGSNSNSNQRVVSKKQNLDKESKRRKNE